MKTNNIIYGLIAILVLVMFIAGCGGTGGTNGTSDSGGSSKSLQDIVSNKIKYQADYTMKYGSFSQDMTMIYDLPKFATILTVSGVESRTIYDGTNIIGCTKVQGQWTCYQTATPPQPSASESIEKSIKEGGPVPVYKGKCSYAGESGLEYEVESQGVTAKVCYTSDGIMLYMSAAGVEMTATKVSRTIDATAFTPPATPTTMPGQ